MGILDDFLRTLLGINDQLEKRTEPVQDIATGDEQASDAIAQLLEEVEPATEVSANLIDVVEETIIADLDGEELSDLENAEEIADQVEGGAVTSLLTLGLLGSVIEGATAGQVDQQQEYITQATAALGVGDVTGTELSVRLNEGIAPALEAKYGAEHRAKFADLQDAVEVALRNKTGDSGYLDGSELPDEVVEKLQSDNPQNPENLIETYGIRDDQLTILEEAAIRDLEPEELIETPAEAGIIPDEELLEEELDRAGISEGAKDLFRETVQEIPKTTRAYEEQIRAEELVSQLDELVASGEVNVEDAIVELDFLPGETQTEIRERFRGLRDLPSGPPTRSQVESGFQTGLIGIDRFTSLLEAVDVDPEKHPYVVQEAIISEIDGDLRQALGLGYIAEGEYQELAEIAGLDEETISRLLEGEDLDDIADSRLQEKVGQGTLAVDTVSGIGSNRRSALEAGEIGTVGALASADPADVADAANVTEDTAADFISSAEVLVGDTS